MIIRHLILALGLLLAWCLLRGWPAALPSLARASLVLPVLAATLAAWSRPLGKPRPSPPARSQPPGWADLAALGMVVLAIECAFLCLLVAAPQPVESLALTLERHLRPEAAALRAVTNQDPSTTGNWLWDQQTRRPLPRRTDFKPGKKPEVFLRLANRADAATLLTGKVYVAAFALGHYENSAWSPIGTRPLTLTADSTGFVRVAPDKPGNPVLHEVFHAQNPTGRSPLTALQGLTEAAVSPLERLDDGLHLLPGPHPRGYQYFARSTSLTLEDLPDDSLLRPWPGADPVLLALPAAPAFESLPGIARKAAGQGALKQQLLALQNHLRTSYAYSLHTANRQDLEPMENFLFDEKRGHCEYFATAGALMARALGIPARVTYGWAGGTWYDAAATFVFRAHEAHAWTEIWLEHHGWVVMDPTPPAQGTEQTRIAAANEPPPLAPASGSPSDQPQQPQANDPAATARHAAWLMALSIPLAAGGLWLRRRHPQPSASGQASHPQTSQRPPAYLAAWQRAISTHGLRPSAGTTLKRQLSLISPPPGFASDLITYHYGRHYENRRRDPRFEKNLTRQIQAWEKSISGINPRRPTSQD